MARSRPPVEGPAGNRTRLANGLVLLGLLVAQLLQRPGSITFDTKFDLTADPSAFLVRSLHLWNPELSFGELQNQAYGYFFPQGPFFLIGDWLGMPDWIVQRLWSALILIAAYEGARRLYCSLATPANPWLPMLAGLAFAFSPRLLGLAGVLSAEVLPTAVLPWVMLPLVHALRGRYSARLGALLSGSAVLMMGGVNAIENLAALPLPALLILSGLGAANGRRLALWCVATVSAASAWWMLPLLVLGRYSPPFLDYIETSAATTRPLGWMNATRGADHWLAFIHVGGTPWWPGAYELATNSWLIAVTGVVAAVSLAGLFHRSMPARTPLGLSALLGLVLLTIAHASSWGSPLAEPMRALLDGPLPMLRNVHKVDPLVRLPMALGFAHAVGLALPTVASSAGRARAFRAPALVVPVVLACAAALLLATSQPMFAGSLRKEGWKQVPRAWQQTVDYLAKNADGGRALVLPGSGFGQQGWGWTIDEPIQGLARSPWVARSQVPLVPGQTLRFLDSIDERISDGRGSPALADVLARAGISHVVVRRDLDLFASGAPAPNRVDQALNRSGGLTREVSFGSSGFGTQSLIDVYAVQRNVPRVEVVDVTGVKTFVGGPEDVITLLEARELAPDQAAVVSAEPGWSGGHLGAVADGYRLRERQFGRLQDSLSQVMSGTEDYRVERRAHDYPGVSGVTRVRASYPDIDSLRASSSSGYADTLGPVRPELGPYSAVDGELTTYWRSAPLENPRGQWLELKLKDPQPLTHVDVTMGVDGFSGVPVRRIRVDAGNQVQHVAVDPATGNVRVPLSGANVDRLRVTVEATEGDPSSGVVAVREISLPGVALGRQLVVDSGGASGDSDFVFRAKPHRRACVDVGLGASCDPDVGRTSEEEAGLYRTFTTDGSGEWSVWGSVVARATPAAAELLSPVSSRVRVQASSVLEDDPAVSGQWANDGNLSTSWLSAPGDLNPSLSLQWSEPRVLTRLRVQSPQTSARAPAIAVLEANGQTRRVQIGLESFGVFNAVRTDHVKITFPMQANPRPSNPCRWASASSPSTGSMISSTSPRLFSVRGHRADSVPSCGSTASRSRRVSGAGCPTS